MTSMKDAVRRLKVIDEACNPKDQKDENPNTDEFTRIKKDISANVKRCRQVLLNLTEDD